MEISSDKISEQLKCVICQRMFRMDKNIGVWSCYMHPGLISDGVWNCCGMSANKKHSAAAYYREMLPEKMRGCVRCDHRLTYSSYTEENGSIDGPFRLLAAFKIPHENARIVGEFNNMFIEANIVRITRYDWRGKEEVYKKYKHSQLMRI